jgi:hypothetical protein
MAVRLPADTIVRLRLRNLWLREAPMQPSLQVAPLFEDFRVDVLHDAQPSGSWLDLPLEPVVPRLVADTRTLELATLAPVVATIRGGVERTEFPYFVAVGISGQVPSVTYLNDVVPLDGDWLVVASAASQTAPFYQGFLGFLDLQGEATCTLDYSSAAPLSQVLNGWQLTLAAFVWDGEWAPTGAATSPCDVMLR